jgi:hypothetical protein
MVLYAKEFLMNILNYFAHFWNQYTRNLSQVMYPQKTSREIAQESCNLRRSFEERIEKQMHKKYDTKEMNKRGLYLSPCAVLDEISRLDDIRHKKQWEFITAKEPYFEITREYKIDSDGLPEITYFSPNRNIWVRKYFRVNDNGEMFTIYDSTLYGDWNQMEEKEDFERIEKLFAIQEQRRFVASHQMNLFTNAQNVKQ